jgi:hypothetical protein
MKKITLVLSILLVLCFPISIAAKDYHYSDPYMSIDLDDTNYGTGYSDYVTAYCVRSTTVHARIKASGRDVTRTGYQCATATLTNVKTDDNHVHSYWHDR